jgi:ubiquitin conjugation factor E4 B
LETDKKTEIEKHYYEKFTVRYHISKIIQQIWPNQIYRERLEQESDNNVDFFVRFVALLLNDVTYVLDNSLTALADIRRLQDELESSSAEFLTQEERETKEKALAKAEKDAQSYMQLGNETVIMLGLFTSAIADAFVQPEIVSRLAGMLDYNLEALVGPKCNNLRVRNPEKYRFNPKALLGEITGVYLNLASKTAFVEAIARDGRSYKHATFELALGVLRKHHLKSQEDMAALAKLADEAKAIKEREEMEEMELGEAPDEFMGTYPLPRGVWMCVCWQVLTQR